MVYERLKHAEIYIPCVYPVHPRCTNQYIDDTHQAPMYRTRQRQEMYSFESSSCAHASC